MQDKLKPERQYLNEFHRQSSEASQKEVERLSKRTYSWEEMHEQTQRKTRGTIGRSRK